MEMAAIALIIAALLLWALGRLILWLIQQWHDAESSPAGLAEPTSSPQEMRESPHGDYRGDQVMYHKGGDQISRPMLILQLAFIALILILVGFAVAELIRMVAA